MNIITILADTGIDPNIINLTLIIRILIKNRNVLTIAFRFVRNTKTESLFDSQFNLESFCKGGHFRISP